MTNRILNLLSADERRQLHENWRRTASDGENDPIPVVRLFMPDGPGKWLLTDLSPDDNDMAFGIGDLGQGCPEAGYARLSDIDTLRGALGLPVEKDIIFEGKMSLSGYINDALDRGALS